MPERYYGIEKDQENVIFMNKYLHICAESARILDEITA